MDFAISTSTQKAQRMKEIDYFTSACGVGSAGLTEPQKQSRIEKILGVESEKLKGFGKDKTKGVELFTKAKQITLIDPEHKGSFDPMTEEIKSNITNYPHDPFETAQIKTHRILNIKIHDNGALEFDGVILDGTEDDVRTRKTYGVISFGDVDSARAELQQKKEGTLKEVSDRTMAIHLINGNLDELFEAPNIDTNKDKEQQY